MKNRSFSFCGLGVPARLAAKGIMAGTREQTTGRWRTGAAGGVVVVLAALLLPPVVGRWSDDLSYDLPFRVRPELEAQQAVIVYMDEDSANKLDQPWSVSVFPIWDRAVHARLVRRLTGYHAKAVVFDVLFDQPRSNDVEFVQAIQAAAEKGVKVVLARSIDTMGVRGAQGARVVPLTEALEAVTTFGIAEVGLNTVTVRRHSLGDPIAEIPSLAWKAAEVAGVTNLPNPAGERWVNYLGRPGSVIPHRSYHEALNPELDLSSVFSNKVCFVGAKPGTPSAAGMLTDIWNTPWKMPMTGVELTATVFLNLANHNWLVRLPKTAELAVFMVAGITLGFGFSWCRPMVAAGLGVGVFLAVTALACWLMAERQVWFSWIAVAAIQVPLAIVWSILAYTKRLTQEKARLEETLATVTSVAPVVNTARLGEDAVTRVPVPHPASSSPAPQAAGLGGMAAANARANAPENVLPAIPDHVMVRRVGRGAYGEVWLARNAIGTYHAVKLVRREDFEHAGPFEREFRGLQNFMPISRQHPGLVQILHVGRHEPEGFIYYIMEAADDETAGERIEPATYSPKNLARELRRRGRLPVDECLRLGLDLTAALEFLHRHQLIHRDIKPANIIFVKGQSKFADIGLVTAMATPGRDVTFLGTEGYIAPEGPGTPAADIYSLGKVLYQAAMGLGCEQFPELPPSMLQRPDRAALFELNEIILKACRDDLRQRYAAASEMQRDLQTLQERLAPK